MPGKGDLAEQVRAWLGERPRLVEAGAFLAVVALVALVAWFVAFSGLSGPVQFVYDSF